MYPEEEYLMISEIQHFGFCRRQWALIHIEQQWDENYRTVDGAILHERVHDSGFHEKRGDKIVSRAMAVSSSRLGISGECDAVEFHRKQDGITLHGVEGRYAVVPVEYKRGKPKEDACDVMQLTAQALCLEEMLCCEIPFGYLYYGETRHRHKVEFDSGIRQKTEDTIEEMHQLFTRKHTPKVKRTRACNACSLKHICLPVLNGSQSAAEYLHRRFAGEDDI